MAKTTKQETAGMVLLHICHEDEKAPYQVEGYPAKVHVEAYPASSIAKVQPMRPLWANQANSFVYFHDQPGEFVTETVEEVAAMVNHQQDTMLDYAKRITVALEQLNKYGIKVDAPEH